MGVPIVCIANKIKNMVHNVHREVGVACIVEDSKWMDVFVS